MTLFPGRSQTISQTIRETPSTTTVNKRTSFTWTNFLSRFLTSRTTGDTEVELDEIIDLDRDVNIFQ